MRVPASNVPVGDRCRIDACPCVWERLFHEDGSDDETGIVFQVENAHSCRSHQCGDQLKFPHDYPVIYP